ncbi:protein ROOT HAIR DEFECTIVE 3-like [Impatiens glandulifera]|uniref:protein ROOT HAIR DEFECTIVE 3-like n=1 Tax=Impatiens glandulifera TaxID=253017 RepID=UPI001FB10537|nr:protein ROOT HAIR DEFECTIVE 3-like [Impatiens glandulifera]
MAKTPIEWLSATLLEDTLKIWSTIPNPKNAAFHDYFVFDIVGLSHYEYVRDQFMEDVTELRKRFSSPSEASLQIKPLVPAIDFVRSTSQIWDKIVNDRTLDIPSHQVMIAKIRCEQIDNDKFNGFIANEEWSQLKVAVNSPPVQNFGQKVTSLIDKYLAEYDVEAEFYDEFVKAKQKEKLKQRLLHEIKPTFDSLLDNLSSQVLSDFKLKIHKELNEGKIFYQAANWSTMLTMFEIAYEDSKIQQVEWTSTKVKKKLVAQLVAQMGDHVDSIRSIKQNEFKEQLMSKLKSGLTKSIGAILKTPGNNMWNKLSDLFHQETNLACSEFKVALEDLGVYNFTKMEELETLKGYGRHIIEKSVRKEIPQIGQIMQKKFCQILLNESADSIIPRIWKGTDNIQDIIKTARNECVNIMSVMAIIRLENKEDDNIQQILSNALLEEGGEGSLTYNNWTGVEASKTLISPAACATIWDQFLKSSGLIINSVEQTIQARIDADKAGLAVPDNEVSF